MVSFFITHVEKLRPCVCRKRLRYFGQPNMDFDVFRALGEQVEKEFRRFNYDDQSFPQIAESALTNWQPDLEFDLKGLGSFLLTTMIKQQPESLFSNLPVTVYRSTEFFIECLIWTDATTTIHQHAFSGAFRVVMGSSLHSEVEFVEKARVSTLLLLGETRIRRFEHLAVGDVRRIISGRTGLLHSLFHLDQPSVTLVIRTCGEPWSQPQYDVYPPTVAAASDILNEDKRVRLAKGIIDVLGRLSPEEAIEVWCRDVVQLDFPRVFTICMDLREHLERPETRERVLAALRKQHGLLEEHLERCLSERSRISSLQSCRASISEREIRFFLALLLNATSRTDVFRILRDRYPATTPEERCAAFFAELGDPKLLLTAVHAVHRKDTWAGAPSRFQQEMVRAKASIPVEATADVLNAVVAGDSEKKLGIKLASKFGDELVDKALAAYCHYRSLPELRVFAME